LSTTESGGDVPRRDVRAEILTAAERIAVDHGVAAVTTKEVAQVAGCSQGSIYNHFHDRSDLLAQVVANRMAAVARALEASGEATPPGDRADRLRRIVRAVATAYEQLIALSTSLVADAEVRLRFASVLEERGTSPECIGDAVTALLASAQTDGSIRSDVDAHAIASMLTGACHQAALHAHLASRSNSLTAEDEERLTRTFATLLAP
jgi:AcrR family transcriptional regulator